MRGLRSDGRCGGAALAGLSAPGGSQGVPFRVGGSGGVDVAVLWAFRLVFA